MTLTKEDLDMLVPNPDVLMSLDEYIDTLKFDNEGIDYSLVIDRDPEEERELDEFLKQMAME
jgi:hypothetical protein